MLGLLGLVGVLGIVSGSAATTLPAFGWGRAIEVPGTAALNGGGYASLYAVSCGAAGDCAAGGIYTKAGGKPFVYDAFVVSETNGSWGDAVEVPGIAALDGGHDAEVYSVSCGAAGDCAAGGRYWDGSSYQAFVVSETNGTWGDAIEVPGLAALNGGPFAEVDSVSCVAAGDCVAGGVYTDTVGGGHIQAFVVSETNGSWGDAVEVPGIAALNSGGYAQIYSVSCAAIGDCAAGGHYNDGSGKRQVFVVSETNGTWGNAVEVPGTAALNSGGNAEVSTVACGAAGHCVAGGWYDDYGNFQAFLVGETNGSWGDAFAVPGLAALGAGSVVSSVSCAAAGACAAGGGYGVGRAFVVSETSGHWGRAIEVPGAAALNRGGNEVVTSVSCAAFDACAAGGGLLYTGDFGQVFVVNSTTSCTVPRVVGKTLSSAKSRLHAALCRVGKITKAYSNRKRGRVVAQKPRAGMQLKHGAKVALKVSKGKKP